jgi:hypothetical protein
MPKRATRNWLSRAALGLTSGALALSLLSTGGTSAPTAGLHTALAEEIDCYNDKDLYNLPECVERRAIDAKTGNQQNEAQGATEPPATEQQASGGQQETGSGSPQTSSANPPSSGGAGQQQPGANQQPTSSGATQQQPGAGQQPATAEADDEEKPQPRAPVTDPRQVALTIADAGKEATQYIDEEGTDKFGKFVRTRFERDRSNGASALGPNVMESKVWVAKDVETAKQLFKEQAAIKNFPERKEGVQGPVEKVKPASYGEEYAFTAGYWQDEKIWQHYRFVMRQGNVVAMVYLFGREEFFQDVKDGKWTGQGDWFTSAVYNRM